MTSEEALAQAIEAKNLIYQPVPLIKIFKDPVQRAFMEAKVSEGRWGLFAVNSDAKSDYWWQNKFGLYNGEDTNTGLVIKKTSNRLTFTAFSRAVTPDLFSDVGCVVFGCSVDFSLENEERFKKDRENLHQTIEHICGRSRYPNIALLVICYRSPLDSTDLGFNDVDLERCTSKGRLDRIRAV
jgi:nuclear mRNA export protein SAC3